jgi:hypothetical protein
VVAELRACADPESGLHHLVTAQFFAGMRVRVESGSLAGLEGVFQRHLGVHKVVVLLDLLGQSARVCLMTDDIVECQMSRAC